MRTIALWRLPLVLIGTAAGTLGAQPAPVPPQADDVLRVCADPDNLPMSNERGEGYENKIAAKLAQDLGRRVEYTFFPQRMGFVRSTLRRRDEATQRFSCDVIIGVPKGYELTATTRAYMHSTYVMVYRGTPTMAGIKSSDDLLRLAPEQRRKLRIGLFAQSPAADWLLRNGMLAQGVFYAQQSGDPHETPARIVERDLAAGKIDLAVVWGPIGGQVLRGPRAVAEKWRSAPLKSGAGVKFDYEISMGVRFGEKQWKETLDAWIAAHGRDIDAILASYRIPLLDDNGNMIATTAPATAH